MCDKGQMETNIYKEDISINDYLFKLLNTNCMLISTILFNTIMEL